MNSNEMGGGIHLNMNLEGVSLLNIIYLFVKEPPKYKIVK